MMRAGGNRAGGNRAGAGAGGNRAGAGAGGNRAGAGAGGNRAGAGTGGNRELSHGELRKAVSTQVRPHEDRMLSVCDFSAFFLQDFNMVVTLDNRFCCMGLHKIYFSYFRENETVYYTENNSQSGSLFLVRGVRHPALLNHLIDFFSDSSKYPGIIDKLYHEDFVVLLVEILGLRPDHPYKIENIELNNLLNSMMRLKHGTPRDEHRNIFDVMNVTLEHVGIFSNSAISPAYLLVCSPTVPENSFLNTSKLNVVILSCDCAIICKRAFYNSNLDYLVYNSNIVLGEESIGLTRNLKQIFTLQQCRVLDTDTPNEIISKVHFFIQNFETPLYLAQQLVKYDNGDIHYRNNKCCSVDGVIQNPNEEKTQFNILPTGQVSACTIYDDYDDYDGNNGFEDHEDHEDVIVSEEEEEIFVCVACDDGFHRQEVFFCECGVESITCYECIKYMTTSQIDDKSKFKGVIKCHACKKDIEFKDLNMILDKVSFDAVIGAIVNAKSDEAKNKLQLIHAQEIFAIKQENKEVIDNVMKSVYDKNMLDGIRFEEMSKAIDSDISEIMKCPHCLDPFGSWDGCNAVQHAFSDTDGREYGCGGYFCGWCISKCSDYADCHAHVLMCPENIHNKGNYFGSTEKNIQNKYRNIIIEFIKDNIDEYAERIAFLEYIKTKMDDLKINITPGDLDSKKS
jgi:hypothetical protein